MEFEGILGKNHGQSRLLKGRWHTKGEKRQQKETVRASLYLQVLIMKAL